MFCAYVLIFTKTHSAVRACDGLSSRNVPHKQDTKEAESAAKMKKEQQKKETKQRYNGTNNKQRHKEKTK